MNNESEYSARLTAAQAVKHPSIWWLLTGGLFFRSLIAWFLPPGFDEAYYFLYSQHLDWSYFDHPLAVAFSTGFGVWLTGVVSPSTIRIGALGLFTGSLWLMYATGRSLFGARAGWICGAIASLSPLFLLTFGTLTAPDNFLIFFWSATLYLCAQEFFFQTHHYQPTYRLSLIGFTVGLACLSKYHGGLLGLGLVCFCLTSARYRKALRSKWMIGSVLLFGVCLLPIVYWNSQHQWISFQFQLGNRFASSALKYSLANLGGVLLAEVGFLFPTIGLPLWWIAIKASFGQLRSIQRAKVQLILWVSLPVAVGFTLLGGLTQIYPAWPAPGLWSLTLLLGHAAASWPHQTVRKWLNSTGLAVGSLLIFALVHITLGTLQELSSHAIFGGFIAPQQDPSTALIDIRQLHQRLDRSEAFQQAAKVSDFVITHEFWLSGYVAMALANSVKLEVGSFTPDPRGGAFWFDSRDWVGKDALFFSIADFSQAEVVEAIAPYFQSITLLTTLETKRGNATTETFYIYQARNLLKPYLYPY